MADTRVASRRGATGNVLARRYGGYSIEAATRPPRDIPPAPPPPPGAPDPRLRPPQETLARPPAWVRAWHRLGYGITPTAKQEFDAFGNNDVARYEAMLEQQLAWESISDSALEARLAAAGYSTLAKTLPQLWADHVASGPAYEVRMLPAWEVQRASLVRAVFSRRQLHERVTTFWHDHFNVMLSDYDAGPVYVHYNRDVMRSHAMGNFRAMLEAMARSTSMMFFLDNRTNRRSGPNENFARELLELHTFGAENYLGFVNPSAVPPCPEDPTYPIGYTDIDVYETAAAFTGWSVRTGTGGDGTFVYNASDHDTGPKMVLGMYLLPEQAALKDGRDVLDRIASHPRVAKFICHKLIRHFATDMPPQSLVNSAAAIFRAQWQNPDQLRLVLRHILRSEVVREGWDGKRRRPSEVVAAAMRAAGADWTLRPDHDRSNDFMWRLGATGHSPYDWPAPNGYPDTATAWSGANSFAMTWKMLGWLTEASDGTQRLMPIVETSRAAVGQWTPRALVDFWCQRVLGHAPAAARLQMLYRFMAQNGGIDNTVIVDDNAWRGSDLKGHYNHDRLRSMVSMLLMSPEFSNR